MAAKLRLSLDQQLAPEAIDVLRAVYRTGFVRGVELKASLPKLDAEKFRNSVKLLVDNSLIGASGCISDDDDLLRSYFSVPPSAAGIVRDVLEKN